MPYQFNSIFHPFLCPGSGISRTTSDQISTTHTSHTTSDQISTTHIPRTSSDQISTTHTTASSSSHPTPSAEPQSSGDVLSSATYIALIALTALFILIIAVLVAVVARRRFSEKKSFENLERKTTELATVVYDKSVDRDAVCINNDNDYI